MNFLAFMPGGSLETRLQSNQTRDGKGNFVAVVQNEPLPKVELWAMEMTAAAAWLESLGFVHGDLRPANLLLDADDHLKLADFDSVDKIGTKSPGSAPPWARLQGDEAGSQSGTWGENGARTEQFAIGSIIYTCTRGFQPYEPENLGRMAVKRLRNMDFPELGDAPLDAIIYRCWRNGFETMGALAEETKSLEGAKGSPPTVMGAQYIAETRERCQLLLDDLLDSAEQPIS